MDTNYGVELHAHLSSTDTHLRPETSPGLNGRKAVWLKPELDGDGEILLPLRELGAALGAIGYCKEDVFG